MYIPCVLHAVPYICHAYYIIFQAYSRLRNPEPFSSFSLSPSLIESQVLTPFPRSIRVYFACSYLL